MANKYENIENIKENVDAKAAELVKKINQTEKRASDIMKKLALLETQQAKKREEERIAAEQKEQQKAQEVKVEEKPVEKIEVKAEPKIEQPKVEEKPKKIEVVEQPKVEEKPVEKVKSQSVAEQKPKAQPQPTEKPAKKVEEKPTQQNKPNTTPRPPRPQQSTASARPQQEGTRPPRPQQQGGGTFINRDNNNRGQNTQNGTRPPRPPQGTAGTRPPRPQQGVAVGTKPQGATKFTPPAPTTTQKPVKKRPGFEKTYVEKERHPVSKRTLAKQQGATVSDFDEEKSGYRKLRVKKVKTQQTVQTVKIEHAVVTTSDIPIKVLSEKLGITAVAITKILFKEGIMKTVNESIDYDTASLVAAEMGIELEYKPEKTAEEMLTEKMADTVEEIEMLVPRAPVVTVMGHVDHGKTSLLDYIRKTKVTAGEAGGITQHIGAYSVSINGKSITFLDTPGHEAFTAMRARGAQVTDIVILVVAADDGIMPQTVEAINHAKAANVSIIVACNKMDKTAANPDRVMQELTNYGLLPEAWGGDTPVIPISCKTGMGIDELLENVLLVAEMKELLANPEREARGTIIEAQLDKGKGPLASVLVQNGTLRTGDYIISGTITGRVRAMIDDKGRTIKEAGPSQAVFVLGFEEVPNAGDTMFAVTQELMKQVIEERKRKESEARTAALSKISLDDVFGKIAEGNMKTLNLIIKGDVQGSVEAVKSSVVKLSNEEVQVKVIHSGAGAITETDVMLADSSNAIILGFNVRPDTKAKSLAERSKVDIRMYRIIYDLLDDIESALKGMLTPKFQEIYLGKCEVRQTFKITGVGNIAGCYVLDGKIVRGGKLRIYRDDVLVVEGNVQQLKRFKDDVKEVSFGFECGCAIEGFNDIKIGDIIECYIMEQIPVK